MDRPSKLLFPPSDQTVASAALSPVPTRALSLIPGWNLSDMWSCFLDRRSCPTPHMSPRWLCSFANASATAGGKIISRLPMQLGIKSRCSMGWRQRLKRGHLRVLTVSFMQSQEGSGKRICHCSLEYLQAFLDTHQETLQAKCRA